MLNSPQVSIVTIEDPIEYAVDDVEQIQVNAKSGLTFANGLRSILRQDPNIIMVGEIRDSETASIAVNTALTGHLLLSTLHTNDAATTLPRLLDMGIEEYLVASTVSIAIGQRLVRKICDNCKEKMELSPVILDSLKDSPFG
jgi:type IV pilus assembly protein PilB